MSFYKDALLHKLQDQADNMDKTIKDAIYKFIDYYTPQEIEQLDLKLVADKFLDEKYKKEEK